MTAENWKPVPDYVGIYEVSDLGRVRRVSAAKGATVGKVLKGRPNQDGYLRVELWALPRPPASRIVHLLVLEAFVGPCPPGMEACHGDGDPGNAALTNLRWDTPQANADDRRLHGTHIQGTRHGSNKLTEDQVREIRAASGSQKSIGAKFGVSQTTVWEIKTGRKWSHLV